MALLFYILFLGEENLYYGDMPTRPVSSSLQANPELSRSVPGIPAATASASGQDNRNSHNSGWGLR